MTADDVKELSEVEVALIALVKVAINKQWKMGEVWKECMTNPVIQTKVMQAVQGSTEIFEEIKKMTVAKVFDLVKAAINELMADSLLEK